MMVCLCLTLLTEKCLYLKEETQLKCDHLGERSRQEHSDGAVFTDAKLEFLARVLFNLDSSKVHLSTFQSSLPLLQFIKSFLLEENALQSATAQNQDME